MKILNVGIVGYGRSGRDIHREHLKDDGRYRIAAVCDPIQDRRERAERENGCETYSCVEDLMKRTDLDLVINSTFSSEHFHVAKKLLSGGFSVVSEKPASQTAEQVRSLIRARDSGGSKFFAFFQQSRNAPYFVKAKEVADSGKLGRIVSVRVSFDGFSRRWDWQTVQRMGGGNLYNTGPHPLDQALRFLDYDGMPKVFCHMDRANSFGDAEDYVKLILTAPGRPLVEVGISSCSAYPDSTYSIQGTCGSLRGSMTHLDWKYFDPEAMPKRRVQLTPMVNESGLPAYCSEKIPWIEESWDMPEDQPPLFPYMSKKYYDLVYDTLVNGADFPIKPEQMIIQIAVIEECHRQNPFPVKY